MSALVCEFLLIASMPAPASAGLFDSISSWWTGVRNSWVTWMMGVGLTLDQVDNLGRNTNPLCGAEGYVLKADEVAKLTTAREKIQKVVILMLENRSFDHYLGEINRYKKEHARVPATTKAAATAATATNLAEVPPVTTAGGKSVPWTVEKIARHKAPLPCTTDLGHEWWAIHRGWNYGNMNKFVTTTQFYMNQGQPNPMANELALRTEGSPFLKQAKAAFNKVFQEKNNVAENDAIKTAKATVAAALRVARAASAALANAPKTSTKEELAKLTKDVTDTAAALVTAQNAAKAAEDAAVSEDFAAFEAAWEEASNHPAVQAAIGAGGYKAEIDRKFGEMFPGQTAAKLPLAAYMMSGAPAMQYFDEVELPFYYELASTFPIGDHYFSPVLGPTFINRNYLYGATSRSMTFNNTAAGLGAADAVVNADEDRGSLIDLLKANDVTHDFFVSNHTSLGVANPYRYGSWLGLKDRFKAIVGKSHHDFFDLAREGRLPQVSFVDADIAETAYGEDEHPPGDVQVGQHLAWEVVRAIMTGPDWDKTVLFITYDENGGYADHVNPPTACEPGTSNQTFGGFYAGADEAASKKWKDDFDQYGIRVPLYVVSPFAKAGGYVSKKTYDHTSIVRFVREVFSRGGKTLAPLTKRDRAADPMLDFFDFTANGNRGAFAGLPANAFKHSYDEEDAEAPTTTMGRVPSVPFHKIQQIPIFSRGPYVKNPPATAKPNTVAANFVAENPFQEPTVDLSKYLICQALLSADNKYATSMPSDADATTMLTGADMPDVPAAATP